MKLCRVRWMISFADSTNDEPTYAKVREQAREKVFSLIGLGVAIEAILTDQKRPEGLDESALERLGQVMLMESSALRSILTMLVRMEGRKGGGAFGKGL